MVLKENVSPLSAAQKITSNDGMASFGLTAYNISRFLTEFDFREAEPSLSAEAKTGKRRRQGEEGQLSLFGRVV